MKLAVMWAVKDWHGPLTHTAGFAWCSGQYQLPLCVSNVCVCPFFRSVVRAKTS